MPTTSSREARQARKLSRMERLQRAFDLFDQGFSNAEVCRRAHLAPNTATKYRRLWTERNSEDLSDNQTLLNQILGNTLQMLRENEQIRRLAYDEFHRSKDGLLVQCPECDHEWMELVGSAVVRNSQLNTLLKTQEHRAKLLGVMGIKQEFFGMVSAVQAVQSKLLEFLERELCEEDRTKLMSYFDSPEMAPYMAQTAAIPIQTIDAIAREAS